MRLNKILHLAKKSNYHQQKELQVSTKSELLSWLEKLVFFRQTNLLFYCLPFDRNHITTDMMDADIILPAIHFPKHLNYNIEWHRGHVDRREEDRQQWTTQERANVAVGEPAGRAWEEDFVEIQHHQIAPPTIATPLCYKQYSLSDQYRATWRVIYQR